MAAGKRTIELTKIAAAALAEKLGEEIVAIDLSDQLVLNQVFLLVTGKNEPQLQALSDEVQLKLAEAGEKPARKEGSGAWILLDYRIFSSFLSFFRSSWFSKGGFLQSSYCFFSFHRSWMGSYLGTFYSFLPFL